MVWWWCGDVVVWWWWGVGVVRVGLRWWVVVVLVVWGDVAGRGWLACAARSASFR